jgi:protease-4
LDRRTSHLEDAIKSAARKAKLDDYKLVNYPEIKQGFFGLLDNSGDKIKTYMVKQELGVSYPYYQKIKAVTNMSGLQARMPFYMEIN